MSLLFHCARYSCACIATLCIGFLFSVTPAYADLTYKFADYGSGIQSGYSLSGEIVVVDTAADDGVLNESEIISWAYQADNGVDFNSSSSADSGSSFSGGVSISATSIAGTSGTISFATDDSNLSYNTNSNKFRLQTTPGGVRWNSTVSGSPVLIASSTAVPEPSTLAGLFFLGVVVTGVGSYRWYRGRSQDDSTDSVVAV